MSDRTARRAVNCTVMVIDGIDSDHVAAICQQFGSSSKTAQTRECLKLVLNMDKHAQVMHQA